MSGGVMASVSVSDQESQMYLIVESSELWAARERDAQTKKTWLTHGSVITKCLTEETACALRPVIVLSFRGTRSLLYFFQPVNLTVFRPPPPSFSAVCK